MAEVTVEIAGRTYRLGCGEGEEAHLEGLAALIDSEARGLQRQFGNMPEARLFLMTALLVADRLSDTERQLTEHGGGGDGLASEREHELAQRVTSLAEHIERMATGKPGT
ncbi:MAG TPA: cell division protein ZapA [Thermohalobaculum sp.]|nr:cell division protein ZapA [Thermohalobaculum sp.]